MGFVNFCQNNIKTRFQQSVQVIQEKDSSGVISTTAKTGNECLLTCQTTRQDNSEKASSAGLTRTQRLCIPNSHAFFYVSRCHLVTEIHHELGKLLDIDNVLGILGVCIDDLCAPNTQTQLHLQADKLLAICISIKSHFPNTPKHLLYL